MGFSEKRGGAVFVLGRNAGSTWCALGDDFIFGIPHDRADDLEQLIREVFKVKICERIGPGFSDICGIPAQEGGMER